MNALQLEIARFLAWKAIAKKRTTYQELAEAIGWPHPTGRGLGKNLYAVLHYMRDKQLPPLTTILVRKGHRYPDDDALDYIREAIGAVDIANAQENVFQYDWGSIQELRAVADDLPGGRAIWRSSFRKQVDAGDTGSHSFLLKFNGELHGPGGVSRPIDPRDWDDQVLSMPWDSPRASSWTDKSPGPQVVAGDVLYLWAHEDEAFGSGLGLTGVAKAKDAHLKDGVLEILLAELALLKSPFGFRSLGATGWNSTVLDRINEDRSPRAWAMKPDEQAEFNELILSYGSRKSDAISSLELQYLSPLDRALFDDREAVLVAEEERKTTTVKARPEQQKFREAAMLRHGGRCVVTGFTLPTVLEAAHVIPHTGNPAFEVPENSLILRRDVHSLFDAGMIAINPKSGLIVVSSELKATAYRKLDGKSVMHKLAPESLAYQFRRFKKSNR
ncbi:HNH endonuclease signature motif containing protein [Sulfitobacter faviae]|uniref:HNH endonuclease n=1 Tax=Sulfitobacter faviae TaxID=1775881 RepID=UPI0023078EFA|nr:HNH endonuclease signature motif containing protein [Sulfitobacter faviae]WCE67013.1 HNH endonuclease signature motif containing protein [Sulfitobacter faviae]